MTPRGIPRREPDDPPRVAVVAYAEYPWDTRVRREAEALAEDGCQVHVIAVQPKAGRSPQRLGNVRLYELPIAIERGGTARYVFQYLTFLLLSSMLLFWLQPKRKFDIIHIHSLPDFQVFSGLLPKASHAAILLDMHEAMPELFLARFSKTMKSPLYRLLIMLQLMSCRFADHIVVVCDSIKASLVSRGVPESKITTVPNMSDTITSSMSSQDLRERLKLPDGTLIVHAGSINPERDLETLVRAIAQLSTKWGISLVLAGQGREDYVESLGRLAHHLGISKQVCFVGRLVPAEAHVLMGLSEMGVVTLESNPHTELSLPARVADFARMGKPLVVADLRFLREFLGGAASYYTPGDAESLVNAIDRNLSERNQRLAAAATAERIAHYFEPNVVLAALRKAYRDLGVPHVP